MKVMAIRLSRPSSLSINETGSQWKVHSGHLWYSYRQKVSRFLWTSKLTSCGTKAANSLYRLTKLPQRVRPGVCRNSFSKSPA